MTDPIADMITRLRNAVRARHQRVDIPASRFKAEIARILEQEGYIHGFKLVDGPSGPGATIRIALKYGPRGERVITGIERVSRPGRRVYFGTAGAAVHIVDPATGEYRESTVKDLYDIARIVDTLDQALFDASQIEGGVFRVIVDEAFGGDTLLPTSRIFEVPLGTLDPTDGFVTAYTVEITTPGSEGLFCNRVTASGDTPVGTISDQDIACVITTVTIELDVANEDGFIDEAGAFQSSKEQFVVGEGGDRFGARHVRPRRIQDHEVPVLEAPGRPQQRSPAGLGLLRFAHRRLLRTTWQRLQRDLHGPIAGLEEHLLVDGEQSRVAARVQRRAPCPRARGRTSTSRGRHTTATRPCSSDAICRASSRDSRRAATRCRSS